MKTKTNQISVSETQKTINPPIDAERRSFSKATVVAPVILTLTSKPVFALQALSNMCSILPSDCRGDNRYGGMSPGFWMTPSGKTEPFGEEWYVAWNLTGYNYADTGSGTGYSSEGFKLKPQSKCSKNPQHLTTKASCEAQNGTWQEGYADGNQCSDYIGGTLNPLTKSTLKLPIREVLCLHSNSDDFHLLAGLLNALYFEAKAGSAENTQYFMTVAQFWGLYNGTLKYPGCYTSLVDLISSNHHAKPDEVCKEKI